MADSQSKARFIDRAAGALLARYIRFVHRTAWQTKEMTETLERHYQHHPCIVSMWHGQFMLLPLIKPSFIPVDIMLARHRDAEALGEMLRHFDMQLIRGAGAASRRKDRGGAHAYMAAVQALRDGRTIAMTADVPGGEARRAGLGIVMVARQSGRPIVPVAIATSRYIALPTWSRMTINLPYSGLGFAVGPIIRVPREAEGEELEHYRQAVEQAMQVATTEAFARAGSDPTRATPARALRQQVEPGFRLKAYRSLTNLARPAMPLLLNMREHRGKEDPARRPERLGTASVARPPGRLAWFHAASVGETNAILPLISALAEARPSLSFLLTTGTVTSARFVTERLCPRTIHQYVPLDAPAYVRRFLDHWKPDLAVLTESEIWPNLILETSARGIPLALINARMTNRSFRRWRQNSGVSRPLFSRFALVVAQNEGLARRFATLGASTTIAAGNLKVDAPPPPVDVAALERLKEGLGGRTLLVAASTHDGEDQIIADAHRCLRQSLPDLCTIIAPRHPERGRAVTEMLRARGLAVVQRSLGGLPDRTSDAYVADTIGELGLLYKLAPVAFIGGSLVDRGGQNPIEAVRQGAVVLTGPHWHNFSDAYRALLEHHGAIVVKSADEIAAAVHRLVTDQTELGSMRRCASAALATISGALPRTIDALLRFLPAEESLARAS
ncbi:MAG TPA: glycosyltransferase N-terminal domain-containing protein [Hyphomicrobiaceae bacterium]|nr:glycosyltransferase N-terminal domain-containing protein [Hyphomicrobiaceae bacterium]